MTAVRDRRRAIRERIGAGDDVRLADLAQEFDVSEMTIRRDLEALEGQGILRRVLGGAIPVAGVGKGLEPSFTSRTHAAADGKAHIAALVTQRLIKREAVYFDGGSTALAVARTVKGRGLELTIVTTSLLVALEVVDEPGTEVILLGGQVRPGELTTIGSEVTESIAQYNVDTYVMGVAGVHPERGLTEYHRDEAGEKRAALGRADRVIVAVDFIKLGKVMLAHVADLSDVHILVTDAAPEHPLVAAIQRHGVEVMCAPNRLSPEGVN